VHVRLVAAEYVTRVRRDRAAIVCTAALRPALAEFVRRFGIAVEILAYGELPPELELRPAGVLTASAGAT
jgi:flagellar biosynthesis component FlhA